MLRNLLQGDSNERNQPLLARIRKHPFHFVVVFLCLINITLILINAGIWLMAAYQQLFLRADFTSFYTGYYMVRVGEGENLYERTLQSEYQQFFMGGLTFEGGVLLFPNPPFVAILFSPLSLLRLDVAFYIWTLMQLGLLAWLLVRMKYLFTIWDKNEIFVLIITTLAFWPLANSLLLGQFSILLLALLVQLYINMKNFRLTKAGLWLAFMAVKPQTLLLPGMMSINRRYWPMALSALIVGLILFGASSIILGIQPWQGYVQSLISLGSYFDQYGVNPNSEYTIRGVVSNLLGNSQGNLTNIVSMIILLVGMIFVWMMWRKSVAQEQPRFVLFFALTIFLSVLLSLHLNPHDSLMLVLPAALFYDYLRQRDYPQKAYTIFILTCPIVFFIAAFSPFNLFGLIRPPIVMMFIMLGWMAFYLVREIQYQEN
jgi:hypothetical protein